MERSSYLELFDHTKRCLPYQSPQEADREEENLLLLLLTLMEKQRAGAVSMEFAAMDWESARLHAESRKKASAASSSVSAVSRIAHRLLLNRAERLALLLAAAAVRGRISPGRISRIQNDPKKDQAGTAAARLLWAFMQEMENRIRPRPQELMRPERLALFLDQGHRPLEEELPMHLRRPVLEMLFSLPVQEKLGGENRCPMLWKRKDRTSLLKEILIYQECFEQMRRMCLAEEGDWTLCLVGSEGSGKTFLAEHLAAAFDLELFVIEGTLWEEGKPEIVSEAALDLISACLLSETKALPYLKNPPAAFFSLLRAYLSGLILVGKEEKQSPGKTAGEELQSKREVLPDRSKWIYLELPPPTASQKGKLWERFLAEYPHTQEIEPQILGSRYVLNAGGIRRVLYAAAKWAAGNGRRELSPGDIAWAVHQSQWGQLGAYAAEIPCVFTWEDLIVEPSVKSQLTYFCDQLKYRSLVGNTWGFFNKMPYGKGLCALFYGPPGTGKTMAVQVIARELGLDVYRVDLSRMVSKYIGETEKHISDLFARAKQMNVILFFDEADAFFSRRLEVKDANDRNANSEVAHLLQKLEEYDGVTILATNLKENMDDAFKRRIQFMVHFRLPSPEIRRQLWHSLLPGQAPRKSDLALDLFAERFELSGSQIKEILLSAAYLAAGQKEALGNAQIKEALCLNYEKYGKRLTDEDFGYLAYY